MFEVGEYVIYGNNGVCVVESISHMDLSGKNDEKLYYTLVPVYSNGSRIYTPVDNNKVVMRSIISRKEAINLIQEMPNIEALPVANEKVIEESYKQVIKNCNCKELVRMIKSLHIRKEVRKANGKKATSTDEKYLRLAESRLYGELAIPLEIEKEKVEMYILDELN